MVVKLTNQVEVLLNGSPNLKIYGQMKAPKVAQNFFGKTCSKVASVLGVLVMLEIVRE